MFKKMATTALLLLSSYVNAEIRDGLYIGFGVGDAIDSFHFRAAGNLTAKENVTRDNVLLNAFAGYGFTANCSNFYFAAELGTTFPERSIQVELPGVSDIGTFFVNELCVRDYLTGDVLLGFRPSPQYLCYLRGGGAFTYGRIFKFANSTFGVPEFNHTEHGGAWRLGSGINYAITCNLGICLDYIFTSYPDVKFFTPAGVELRSWVHSNYVAFSTVLGF